MKAKSARGKGSRFESYLVKRLQEIDPDTRRNYASGSGYDKGDCRMPLYDFNIEAKNASAVHLVKDFKQADDQCVSGGIPVLMIRNPKQAEFKQTYVVMDLEDWLEVMSENTMYQTDDVLTNDTKWKLKRLKDAANDVIKII